jgi:hypothetical protein
MSNDCEAHNFFQTTGNFVRFPKKDWAMSIDHKGHETSVMEYVRAAEAKQRESVMWSR